ncbi:hypothetical protein [Rhizobium sp. MHM7A]|uniref:hypothetical protein n=1 Tax=Rhizobium sp. MHM7A TaxID=2583233 RepID=UPI00110662D9|nr:hypothetical protein [Rhizobium sp. MHM7A]TLX16506.1 hypothetical protein FFR93_03985 [Rhizobium sp. MHM7A]
MLTNLFVVAAVGVSGAEPAANMSLPADVSSKIGLYLLVSAACDQMVGTDAGRTAKSTSGPILQSYGFTNAEVESMMKKFVGNNLDYYIASVVEASGNSKPAIRYFCSSTIKQKQKAVEEIKAYNQP